MLVKHCLRTTLYSVQGEKVDEMLKVTLLITGIVRHYQIVLFWFAFKYQGKR